MSEVFTKWVRQLKEFWQSHNLKKGLYNINYSNHHCYNRYCCFEPIYTTLINNSTQKETGNSGILTENNIA